jgi:16S rRNA (uracil1498-N3)-methyltransferase
MSNKTFYIEPNNIQGKTAILTGEELHHARNVMRLEPGDEIELVDGLGNMHRATFLSISSEEGKLEISSTETENDPSFSLTMAMGIVKGERFEWALQKCTELGVAAFIPLITERTEVKPAKPWPRLKRLEKIIISACKQCERARFPVLESPIVLEDLKPSEYDLTIVLWESGSSPSLNETVSNIASPVSCLLVIGPVGGFTDGEIHYLVERGFIAAGFGPRILRTETAATAGAAVLGSLFGDLG